MSILSSIEANKENYFSLEDRESITCLDLLTNHLMVFMGQHSFRWGHDLHMASDYDPPRTGNLKWFRCKSTWFSPSNKLPDVKLMNVPDNYSSFLRSNSINWPHLMTGIHDKRPDLSSEVSREEGVELRRMRTDSRNRGQVLAQMSTTITRLSRGSR